MIDGAEDVDDLKVIGNIWLSDFDGLHTINNYAVCVRSDVGVRDVDDLKVIGNSLSLVVYGLNDSIRIFVVGLLLSRPSETDWGLVVKSLGNDG